MTVSPSPPGAPPSLDYAMPPASAAVRVPAFLNTTLAAEFLGLKAPTLELYRIRGGGPRYRKHGRLVLYHRDDLIAWSEARTFSSTAEADSGLRRLHTQRPRRKRRGAKS